MAATQAIDGPAKAARKRTYPSTSHHIPHRAARRAAAGEIRRQPGAPRPIPYGALVYLAVQRGSGAAVQRGSGVAGQRRSVVAV
eukprot:gene11814-20694_t